MEVRNHTVSVRDWEKKRKKGSKLSKVLAAANLWEEITFPEEELMTR